MENHSKNEQLQALVQEQIQLTSQLYQLHEQAEAVKDRLKIVRSLLTGVQLGADAISEQEQARIAAAQAEAEAVERELVEASERAKTK